ncbi:thioesterase II family protein [Streptomyces sp. MB22_4]|uniref:thioesterase II family protein n=1 Tax=Streptomyces sp. MB22_4 TaxID=3383120 RepID=UPI0039A029C6
MNAAPSSPWLMEWPAAEAAGQLLVICHHAGGGAGQFRSWQDELGPDTGVLALQLPGRQNRWTEPVLESMDAIVAGALPALLARLDRPFTIFGHSMGGLVGFELARVLGQVHGLWPDRLIVSATRPPHHHHGDLDLSGYDDEEVVRHFVGNGTLPEWVLDDKDLQALLLPPLRGDFAICDDYRYRPGEPLACPLTLCGGTEDEGVTPEALDGWGEYAGAGWDRLLFPGGHLFHLDPDSGLLPAIARLLTETAPERHTQGAAS